MTFEDRVANLWVAILLHLALIGSCANEVAKIERAYRECEAYHDRAILWFAKHQVPEWPPDLWRPTSGFIYATSDTVDKAVNRFLREHPPARDPWGNDHFVVLHNWYGNTTWTSCFCVVSAGPNGKRNELSLDPAFAGNDDIYFPRVE